MVENRRATEPLATTAAVFSGLLIGLIAVVTVASIWGSGSFGGFGDAQVCATGRQTVMSEPSPSFLAHSVRPGAYLNLNSAVQACAAHPGLWQRILYTLTSLPSALLWVGGLLLLWRLIRIAARRGPLALEVAGSMRLLGWFVLAGSLVAIVGQAVANQLLLNTMLAVGSDLGGIVNSLIAGWPVPLLVGAGLLTFARITRLGAALDEEIKGTI
jgi:hypothetical protein